MAKYNERELTEPVDLALPNGRLNPDAVGWSRLPIHRCNVSGSYMRKKRWNYWAITTKDFLFSVTLSKIDYIDLAFVYFLDFTTKKLIETIVPSPFGYAIELGRDTTGDCLLDSRKLKLSMTQSKDGVLLAAKTDRFGGKQLESEITVSIPAGHESMNVVIPWSDKRYQYTSKQFCLPAKGFVRVGEKIYYFNEDNSYACLDFGRGKWPYRSQWNWSSMWAHTDAGLVGHNLGAQWTDGTGYTENAVMLNGRLMKLGEDVEFGYNSQDFMKPWTIRSTGSDAVDLLFTPLYEKVNTTSLGIVKVEVHQCIGRFTGTLVVNGATAKVTDGIGWAEEHRSRW